jgi:hypothetical protein
MPDTAPARRSTAREAVALVGGLGVVLLAAALSLRALDALPRVVSGEHRGVTRYESIAGAERALGSRLFLPAFFPDTLQWPPTSIRVYAGPPVASALAFAGRDGSPDRLVIYQAPGRRATVPMALMPAGRVLQTVPIPMAEGDAQLVRLELADGTIANDLIWYRPDVTLAFRYAGPANELLTIAHSVRRRRP